MQTSELIDWAEHFFKNMDLIQRKMINLEVKGDKIDIEYKDKLLHVYTDERLSNLKPSDEDQAFVIPNSKANLQDLIERWDELAAFSKLKIYFVNPYSMSEKRWIISPYIHNRIAERENLELGLRALFNSVGIL